jgi:hypothetical protein
MRAGRLWKSVLNRINCAVNNAPSLHSPSPPHWPCPSLPSPSPAATIEDKDGQKTSLPRQRHHHHHPIDRHCCTTAAASEDNDSHFNAAFTLAIDTAVVIAVTIAFAAAITAILTPQLLSPLSLLLPLPLPLPLPPPPMPLPTHPHPCLCSHYCCSLRQRHCTSDPPVNGWLLCHLPILACCVIRRSKLSVPPVVRSSTSTMTAIAAVDDCHCHCHN